MTHLTPADVPTLGNLADALKRAGYRLAATVQRADGGPIAVEDRRLIQRALEGALAPAPGPAVTDIRQIVADRMTALGYTTVTLGRIVAPMWLKEDGVPLTDERAAQYLCKWFAGEIRMRDERVGPLLDVLKMKVVAR